MTTEENKVFEHSEQAICENSESNQTLDDKSESFAKTTSEVAAGECGEADIPPTPIETPPDNMPCPQIHNAEKITQRLEGMEAAAIKAAAEMRELHKLYHNEFAGRLKKMQDELDEYHEIGKGRVFDGILSEIAKLYSDNENLTNTLESKQLKYMFMDLLQMLENNGVHVQKSKVGDRRNTKHSQIIEQIATDDLSLHDTVAESLNTGFYVENRTLVKERIHVNVFKEPKISE